MKRLHVHVAVKNIEQSTRFYSALFATEPAVVKADYAKWMLDDPRVNFAISTRGREPGLDHLGIQVEDAEELKDVSVRLKQAGAPVLEQGATTCCYAQSEKSWINDPQGIAWETFLTTGESTVYGEDGPTTAAEGSACCAPTVETPCCGRTQPPKTAAETAACCG
jgi:catechol 2,3-dioxygenase-like lactoylglutathione lyase family enzyme